MTCKHYFRVRSWPEIPAFAPNGEEGRAYGLEEIGQMLRVLDGISGAVVATATYTGLRLGELRGLTWEAYTPPQNEDELGMIFPGQAERLEGE